MELFPPPFFIGGNERKIHHKGHDPHKTGARGYDPQSTSKVRGPLEKHQGQAGGDRRKEGKAKNEKWETCQRSNESAKT
jgi:hypothetical protein